MIKEFSNNDVKDVKNPSLENYKNIKPQEKHTIKEDDDFWKSEFKKEADNVKNGTLNENVVKDYKDDNGDKYREGNNLIPNNEFKINGYDYKTDENGRIISAGGKLRLCDSDYKRSMEDVKKIQNQDYHDGDERGHLIAHRLGGSDKLENLLPMDAKLNQGDYAKMENTLADAVKDGADVRMNVEPVYEGNSTRPSEFRVTYSIDGDKEIIVFKNERRN